MVLCSLFVCIFSVPKCYAQNGEQPLFVDYSKFNVANLRETADKFFELALKSDNAEEKSEYLRISATQYNILSNADKSDIYPYIQLARIYDVQKNDSYAKAYFYKALGVNSKNTDANFYIGEFYYLRKQFKKALIYYQKALKYGRESDAYMMKKMGIIYEKFGDLPRANVYYKKSSELNPEDKELFSKVQDAEKIKDEYEKSGYYKRRLRY